MIQPKVQFHNFDVLRVRMYEMEWVCKKGKGYVRNEKGIWEMERVYKKWKGYVRNGNGM